MTSASARGLATITHDGTVLDVWFPAVYTDKNVETTETKRLEEVPQQFSALAGPDEERGVARVAVETSIKVWMTHPSIPTMLTCACTSFLTARSSRTA